MKKSFGRIFLFVVFIFFLSNNTSFSMGSSDDSEQSKSMDANFVSGKKAVENKNFDKAIKLLKKSLSNDSLSKKENADALNLIGFSYRMQKNYDQAFLHYKKALTIDPKHKPTLEYLGVAYLETNDLSKAEEIFSNLKNLCSLCVEKRSLNKAIKNYKKKNN